jgi:5'-nucleotidase
LQILLTNDDGINAPGIHALVRELSQLGNVFVVAPDAERSATSQAITVHQPIRVDKHALNYPNTNAWRIGGTPTDCVKIALETDLITKPDIVVSGINHGPNLGTDVLYSGTVSAAIEAALHGLPAIAMSLNFWQPGHVWQIDDFTQAAKAAKNIVQKTLVNTLPPNTLLNVNVPAGKASPEVVITKLGVREYENTFERRQDPHGRTYYWMGGKAIDSDNAADTDIAALKAGNISVTPVHFDLTNYAIMDILDKWQF